MYTVWEKHLEKGTKPNRVPTHNNVFLLDGQRIEKFAKFKHYGRNIWKKE
jgi:hypothetical protein